MVTILKYDTIEDNDKNVIIEKKIIRKPRRMETLTLTITDIISKTMIMKKANMMITYMSLYIKVLTKCIPIIKCKIQNEHFMKSHPLAAKSLN